MTDREEYAPGPAHDAEVVRKGEENWTFILRRELRHPPEKVWRALTEPALLREWAPFDADRALDAEGEMVRLATIGARTPHVTEATIKRAEPPRALEYEWGAGDVRWELEPITGGTLLTLWATIDRQWIAMGATGWHICLDVLDHLLDGAPIGRLVGPDAVRVDGFKRLNAEYAEKFGVATPSW